MYVCMYVCMYLCMYVCMYVCMYGNIYVCTSCCKLGQRGRPHSPSRTPCSRNLVEGSSAGVALQARPARLPTQSVHNSLFAQACPKVLCRCRVAKRGFERLSKPCFHYITIIGNVHGRLCSDSVCTVRLNKQINEIYFVLQWERISMYISIYIYTYTHIYIYIQMQDFMHICIHTWICACIHACLR